jgi:WD40 repeat protein
MQSCPQPYSSWDRFATNLVFDAKFSPDGKNIASSSRDGTTKLWDADTGELLLNLFGDGSGGGGVGITSDGARLLTAGENGVRLYLLNLPELIDLAKSRLTRDFTKQECWTYLHTRTCPTPFSSMIEKPSTE